MIIGIHQRGGDLSVNICKAKALTNMRSAGTRARPLRSVPSHLVRARACALARSVPLHPEGGGASAAARSQLGRATSSAHACALTCLRPLVPRASAALVSRSAGKDKDDGVVPKVDLSLDACIEYISEDELVEVTPLSVRMLKNPDLMNKKKGRSGA
jgi:predicted membrane GTPase involved in stress response